MKNLFFALIALVTLSLASCKKEKDITPTCNTCNPTPPTPTPTPTPSPWGAVNGTYTGFIYGTPESGAKEYERNANGDLVFSTIGNNNYVTDPYIWGAWVFDASGNQSVPALLENGTGMPGNNQKICDWLANSNHYVEVRFTENENGDPFGKMRGGTLMYYKITTVFYRSW